VTLNDDFSLGIDWSRLSGPTTEGLGFNFNSNSIIGQPAGGFIRKLPFASLDIFNIAGNTLELSALVDALREQGAVKIVSHPQFVTEGSVLALTPQISASGWIMLDVSPVITRVSSISRVLEANGQVRSSAPNLDIRQASSLVRVRSGETIVIGGLIQDQENDTERSVPGVSSLPLVGNLFKDNYQVRGKKELVMFLIARLVKTPDLTALG
jgi:type II secretory pathway component GspD/PulD (secretin)